MKLYTTVEEKFCIKVNKNVAIEIIRYADGTHQKTCLHQKRCSTQNCPISKPKAEQK